MGKMKKITLKKAIKQLAKAKITGTPLKYVYYCYDDQSYNQIISFDLMDDTFKCVNKASHHFDCKDKNLQLCREKINKDKNNGV